MAIGLPKPYTMWASCLDQSSSAPSDTMFLLVTQEVRSLALVVKPNSPARACTPSSSQGDLRMSSRAVWGPTEPTS